MGSPEGLKRFADEQYLMFCYVCGGDVVDDDYKRRPGVVVMTVPPHPPAKIFKAVRQDRRMVQATVCESCLDRCSGVREEAEAQGALYQADAQADSEYFANKGDE